MNFKEKTKQIKTWARDNKGKIILGLGLITTGVVMTMLINKSKTSDIKPISIDDDPTYRFDCGKDLEMHFVDPENGNVLWKELCTESYMNDFKNCGMQYEAVRKLNGIEEEA